MRKRVREILLAALVLIVVLAIAAVVETWRANLWAQALRDANGPAVVPTGGR